MRVLVVEDEIKIASSIKKGLEQEGYAVDVSHDGYEAYDLAFSEDYDVIVLDLMLPGMDGTTICSKLRKNNVSTPILMLTAKGDLDDRVNGLNCGADDYLVKPFEFEELLARLRALLRRPKDAIASKLICGDLILDPLNFSVMRDNKNIELSKKEFSLLEYLMRNKNTILTKDKIIEHVWNFDSDVLPNTVEVYIGYLRSKIDKPFKNSPNLIKTIRGFGYSLKESNKNV